MVCIEVRWERGRPAGILGGVEDWERVTASACAVERVGTYDWPAWKDVYRVLPHGPACADPPSDPGGPPAPRGGEEWRHYLVGAGAIDA
jgi:hypothetical protein